MSRRAPTLDRGRSTCHRQPLRHRRPLSHRRVRTPSGHRQLGHPPPTRTEPRRSPRGRCCAGWRWSPRWWSRSSPAGRTRATRPAPV